MKGSGRRQECVPGTLGGAVMKVQQIELGNLFSSISKESIDPSVPVHVRIRISRLLLIPIYNPNT